MEWEIFFCFLPLAVCFLFFAQKPKWYDVWHWPDFGIRYRQQAGHFICSLCVCVFFPIFHDFIFFHRPENGRKRVPSLVSWPHPILWKIISPFNDLREAAEEKLIRKQSILVHKIQYEIHQQNKSHFIQDEKKRIDYVCIFPSAELTNLKIKTFFDYI